MTETVKAAIQINEISQMMVVRSVSDGSHAICGGMCELVVDTSVARSVCVIAMSVDDGTH